MAKVDNYIAGREDGLQLALNIVKKKGVKGLEDEIRFRNATKIHTLLDKKKFGNRNPEDKRNDRRYGNSTKRSGTTG